MRTEQKKRINTSIFLILLLITMFLYKTVFLFVSLILFVYSFIEFSSIIKIILKKNKIKIFFINTLFLIYMFIILLILMAGINDFHLRIILFTIILICITSDIGGYVFGKIFKGPKLTSISPNKTFSGSFGSFLLSSITSSYSLNILFNNSLLENIFIGLIISLSVQLGDLLFSYLKRKSKLKDTGKILPGHGGLLDRIDGIIFGLPIGLIMMLTIII